MLLDFWIVRRFTGSPQGLDGQELKWSTAADIESIALLPADRPMLRLLSLPDEITARSAPDYEIASPRSTQSPGRLYGAFCRDPADAATALAKGADFIVLADTLPDGELSALCWALDAPVFARVQSLQHAWDLGASGVHTLAG